jgi:hypothetical protein
MRPIYLLSVIAVLTWTPAFAQSWGNFFYEDSGVDIQFPIEPKVSQGTYPAGNGSVPATIYSVQQDTSQYTLTVADFSKNSGDLDKAVDKALSDIRGGGDVKLDVDECISGQPGREFSVVGKDGSASKSSVFAVQDKLYLLEAKVLPPNVQRDSGDAARFQQSMSFGKEIAQQPICKGRAREASTIAP